MTQPHKTIGIVGARGYVGAELIRLITVHPHLALGFVSSRELDGQRVADHVAEYEGELRYRNIDHNKLGQQAVEAVETLPAHAVDDVRVGVDVKAPTVAQTTCGLRDGEPGVMEG